MIRRWMRWLAVSVVPWGVVVGAGRSQVSQCGLPAVGEGLEMVQVGEQDGVGAVGEVAAPSHGLQHQAFGFPQCVAFWFQRQGFPADRVCEDPQERGGTGQQFPGDLHRNGPSILVVKLGGFPGEAQQPQDGDRDQYQGLG